MAKPKLENVISHWQKPFADFQTSPLEFYQAVEAAAGRKEIPGLSFSRIDYTEGGIHTPNREYLRITRDRLTFDVCAAPFSAAAALLKTDINVAPQHLEEWSHWNAYADWLQAPSE